MAKIRSVAVLQLRSSAVEPDPHNADCQVVQCLSEGVPLASGLVKQLPDQNDSTNLPG